MATYRLRPDAPHLQKRRWSLAARLLAVAGLAALLLVKAKTAWLVDLGRLAGLYALWLVYCVWYAERQWAERDTKVVEVSAEGLWVTSRGQARLLPRASIKSVVDRPYDGGLLVVSNRRRDHPSVLVSGDLEGYEACRAEILALGAPLVPLDRTARGKVISLTILIWSFIGAVIAQSPPLRIAGGVLVAGVLLVMWVLGWTKPQAGQTCEVPDRSPEAQSRSRLTLRLWGIGLTAAGIAVMMAEAWWTHGTDDFGLGFGAVTLGVIVYAFGFFGGPIGQSALALLALIASAGIIDGLTRLVAHAADLGDLILTVVAFVAVACYLVSLVGRSKSIMTMGLLAIGPTTIALGARDQWRGRNGLPLLVEGVAITMLTVWDQSGWRRDWLGFVVPPVRWAAAAVGFVAWTTGHQPIANACSFVFVWTMGLPSAARTATQTSPSAA